ncbi:MAG: DNA replication/repair protein RecF [Deltaproteobacteria bacterium]
MKIAVKSITLKNYRNYRSETLSFHERFNLICGENAQGKTNLLEAVHTLCTFRAFKQIKIEDLIAFGDAEARIKGEIFADSDLNEIHIALRKNAKAVKLNGKIIQNLSGFGGRFNVVSFLPLDSELVKGSPQERRKYADSVLCNFYPEHLRDMKAYLRSVTQRNALLAQAAKPSGEMLDIWNGKISEVGARIIKRRIGFIEILEPLAQERYRLVSGIKTAVEILYKSSCEIDGDIENALRRELDRRVGLDRKRGYTSAGPHRDLIEFSLAGRNAQTFASQGEAKTLAAALKAAEIAMTETALEKTPILLLDDVTSELDGRRRGFLFETLREFAGQVFVTTANPEEIPFGGDKKTFRIRGGRAES